MVAGMATRRDDLAQKTVWFPRHYPCVEPGRKLGVDEGRSRGILMVQSAHHRRMP